MALTTRHGPRPASWNIVDAAPVARASCARLKAARGTEMSRWISQSVSEPKPTIAAATGAGNR